MKKVSEMTREERIAICYQHACLLYEDGKSINNQIVRDQLKFEIKICLVKNGYPPQYSPEVFRKVMEQVENFEENQ